MAEEKIAILEENPADFKRNVLPTNAEVVKAIYYKHLKKEVTYKAASDAAAWCIMAMWSKLGIPILGHRAIESRVQKLFGDFQKILGSNKTRQNFQSKVNQFNVSSSLISIVHLMSATVFLCVVLCVRCHLFFIEGMNR